jgi:hypothetical protein
MMGKSIDSVRVLVYELGKKINAPLGLLSLPNKPIGDGTPHIEIEDDRYHFVSSERGRELWRKSTIDLNELMYWVFSLITSSMAYKYERKNRIEGKDHRRIVFSKQIELLNILNPEWSSREEIELKKILLNNPYDDDKNARLLMSEKLIDKGVAPEEAYQKACLKYPLPERAIDGLTE